MIPRSFEPLSERVALDQLENEALHPLADLETMNRRDVGMVQRGEQVGFALQPRRPFRITDQGLREDLDGDIPFELRIGGPVDLSHPARADAVADDVRAYAISRIERH